MSSAKRAKSDVNINDLIDALDSPSSTMDTSIENVFDGFSPRQIDAVNAAISSGNQADANALIEKFRKENSTVPPSRAPPSVPVRTSRTTRMGGRNGGRSTIIPAYQKNFDDLVAEQDNLLDYSEQAKAAGKHIQLSPKTLKNGKVVQHLPEGHKLLRSHVKPKIAVLVYNKETATMEVQEPKSEQSKDAKHKNLLFAKVRRALANSPFVQRTDFPQEIAFANVWGAEGVNEVKRLYKAAKRRSLTTAQRAAIVNMKRKLEEKTGISYEKGMIQPPQLVGRTGIGNADRHNYKVTESKLHKAVEAAKRRQAAIAHQHDPSYQAKLRAAKIRYAQRRNMYSGEKGYPQAIRAQRSRVLSPY